MTTTEVTVFKALMLGPCLIDLLDVKSGGDLIDLMIDVSAKAQKEVLGAVLKKNCPGVR